MAKAAEQWPTLSVVLPVRNDAEHLHAAVAAVLEQDYPQPFEVVVAVGPSSDGTERVASSLASRDRRVRVVDNPNGGTAAGLNAAIAACDGDVVARVDGHAELSPGYLRTAVEVLGATGADNVGGIQRAVGLPGLPTQQAIAAAMTSPFGVGDASFHYGGHAGPTDTVYLGVFRRSALERAGGFDESLVRNQDYELNWRIRDAGGVVWFDPRLEVTYRPRTTLRALADQYRQYGQWKRVVLRRHPRSLRWRQLVPPMTLLVNVGSVLTALALRRAWPLAAPGTYAAATVAASVLPHDLPAAARLRLPAAYATMHHAWAWGFVFDGQGASEQ